MKEREKVTLNLDKTLSGGGTENKDQRNKWTVDKTTTTEAAGTRHAGTMEKREGKRKSSLRWANKVKSMAVVVVVICIEGQHIERVSEDVSYQRTQATADDDDGSSGQIKELQTKHNQRQI